MPNPYVADILAYQPSPWGGYTRTLTDGDQVMRSSCSDDGMTLLVLYANLYERWSGHLAAARSAASLLCEHQQNIPAEWGWSINDYGCDPTADPRHVDFWLWGFHEDATCCAPLWAHTVPSGLIVWTP